MTNYAQIEVRQSYLSTDFGEELARKWFGDESIDALPRFTRGPRKGKIKGVITWSKVVRGGWVSTGRETASGGYSGYVETRVGRIFDRRLCELESGQYGISAGKVIRDLDKEIEYEKYAKEQKLLIDKEIRRYERERSAVEAALIENFDILNDSDRVIIGKLIKDYDEDIACLVKDITK